MKEEGFVRDTSLKYLSLDQARLLFPAQSEAVGGVSLEKGIVTGENRQGVCMVATADSGTFEPEE